jgi:anti-sigma regulatory factor (Ser/Thr protein kinase)
LPWLVEVLLGAEQQAVGHGGEFRLLAEGSELGLARQYVRDAAESFGFDPDRGYELVYAVNEAVTNAIRHGAPDAEGCISLSVYERGDRLTFVVRDFGSWVMPTLQSSAMADHGRGFALMASLVDDVQLSVEPGCTTISLSKARTPADAAVGEEVDRVA